MERKAAPEKFFERLWVQRVCLGTGLVIPSIGFIALLLPEPGAMLAVAVILSVMFLYMTFSAFDPGSLPGPSNPDTWYGAFLKLLAILHAVAAIFTGFHLVQKLELGDDLPMPAWAMGVLIGWMWLVTALAYLAGDAQMRAARPSSKAQAPNRR